jgi:hypothetical protein
MSIERAFCRSKDHMSAFRAYGLPDKLIYVDGRGAEDLEACIASFRGRPGTLMIAPDLTVFGAAKRDVAAAMARLERARIKVVDVIHPQDGTVAEMMHRASVLISGSRFQDRRTARRRGRDGGIAKGQVARSARLALDTDTFIRNLVAEDGIPWPVKARILQSKISESTLRRHYRVPA